jgi:hypothetical protein
MKKINYGSKKFYIKCFLGCFLSVPLMAQQSPLDKAKNKPLQFATTGIGVSYLNKAFEKISKEGIKTYSGLELQWKNHYLIRLSYEIGLYKFDNSIYQNGFKVTSKGSRTLWAGFVDLGYREYFNKWSVYGLAGFGIGQFLSPNTSVNAVTMEVNTQTLRKLHTMLRAGVGVEFALGPKFMPFVEFQYGGLLQKTIVNNNELRFSNLMLGFKANLNRKNLNKIQ